MVILYYIKYPINFSNFLIFSTWGIKFSNIRLTQIKTLDLDVKIFRVLDQSIALNVQFADALKFRLVRLMVTQMLMKTFLIFFALGVMKYFWRKHSTSKK